MKKKLTLKGSYTIEASFLMPMILTVIVIIIYLTFFLHDRTVLNSVAYTAAMRGSQLTSGEDVYAVVEDSGKKLIKNRLLATKNVTTDVSVQKNKISVSYRGVLKIPAGTLLCRYLTNGRDSLEVNAQAQADCINPVSLVRKMRVVEGYASDLTGQTSSPGGGEDPSASVADTPAQE